MGDYEAIIKKVNQTEGVNAAAPFILNQVMLTYGSKSTGVVVRGSRP